MTTAPYQPHSATSEEAAAQILPAMNTMHERIYKYLKLCGSRGATDDEMQRDLKMNASTQRPRRIELVEKGVVEGVEGNTRKTLSMRMAQVWTVCDQKPVAPKVSKADQIKALEEGLNAAVALLKEVWGEYEKEFGNINPWEETPYGEKVKEALDMLGTRP